MVAELQQQHEKADEHRKDYGSRKCVHDVLRMSALVADKDEPADADGIPWQSRGYPKMVVEDT